VKGLLKALIIISDGGDMIGSGASFVKAGQMFDIIEQGVGRLMKKCKIKDCEDCRDEPYFILPCKCHGLMVACSCQFKDQKCRRCGRCWIPVGSTWYEVKDPHTPVDHTAPGHTCVDLK